MYNLITRVWRERNKSIVSRTSVNRIRQRVFFKLRRDDRLIFLISSSSFAARRLRGHLCRRRGKKDRSRQAWERKGTKLIAAAPASSAVTTMPSRLRSSIRLDIFSIVRNFRSSDYNEGTTVRLWQTFILNGLTLTIEMCQICFDGVARETYVGMILFKKSLAKYVNIRIKTNI